jgi:hypothetical protein
MPVCRSRVIAILASISVSASGCLGGSSPPSGSQPSTSLRGAVKGTLEGRVFTTACGGPAASSCRRQAYRGSLVFCKRMGQIGFCPSARVDGRGRYAITLTAGRYALVPAPGSRNVVMVTPRWVWIAAGRATTLDINGGNATF